MSTVRGNVLANLAGQGWSAALQLLMVPVYLHFLGIESYGLISLYMVLVLTVLIFDLGLAQTLNRELARSRARDGDVAAARDLVRTVELAYVGLVILVCGALLAAAPLFSRHVLTPDSLDPGAARHAVVLMIVVVALQWPTTLYQNGLMGLQLQLLANTLRVALASFAALGAVLVLWLVSPTVVAFFLWQIVAAAVALTATRYALHSRLPRAATAARFRPDLFRRLWRFAAGVSALMFVTIVLTQGDKWILVQRLSLEAFGYFGVAWTAATGLAIVTTPVFAAIFPRFSTLVARGERAIMLDLYHRATQVIAAGVGPLALLLSLYAEEVLFAWTGKEEVAYFSGPLLGVLVLGMLLNNLAHPPYASELAHGRTGTILKVNAVSAVFVLAAVWMLAPVLGAMGAALVWFAVSAVNFAVAVPMVHDAMLPREERVRWLLRDIALPLAAAAAALLATRAVLPAGLGRIELALALIVILALGAGAAIAAAPAVRALLWPRPGGAGGR